MLQKPDACRGCPLYQDGRGFVPDEIVEGAEVFVLGQNPGAEEAREGRPFVGRTGEMMLREFFPRGALARGENVSLGNALRCRFQHTNKLPPEKTLRAAIEHCTAAHFRVPTSTRLVVATGATAWKACGQATQITDWRGFLAPTGLHSERGEIPVLGTLHVADLFRDPKMRIPSHRDWAKIPLVLAGVWPRPMPEQLDVSWETVAAVETWFEACKSTAPFLAVDTEYDPATKELFLIGMGYPDSQVLQARWPACNAALREHFVDELRDVIGKMPVVFQNAAADLPVLERHCGIALEEFAQIEDTLLAHSVLWSEWPHKLSFLASLYGEHARMKHLARENPLLYNAGDVVDTLSSWRGMQAEFTQDPAAARVYRTQPIKLLPIVIRAHERGIRVNQARVKPAAEAYQQKLAFARGLAQAYVGWPLNIGSDDQLRAWLYDVEHLPVQRNKTTNRVSVDADSMAELRKRYEPAPDLEQERREGLTGAEIEERIAQGAHPLLETRVLYMAAQQAFSHYIKPCLLPNGQIRERVYPEFHIHAQANARWSTVNPDACGWCAHIEHRVGMPMAQLPVDLRDIVCPDVACTWLEWDWDQIELRLNAALCRDEPSLEAFRRGWDIHTLNTCDIFGYAYPPEPGDPHGAPANEEWRQTVKWKGKEDPRRGFAKRFVYRLDYGGDPTRAGDISGAKVLGLTARALVQASNLYLAAHPAKRAWRMQTRLRVNRPPRGELATSATFLGRKRRILATGPAAARIAFDHPMQAGVSDIANLTAIRIEEELPWLELMYQMHDGWKYQCPTERVKETWPHLREIVEAEWDVDGTKMRFPATFKERPEAEQT